MTLGKIWFSLGTPVSLHNTTYSHGITTKFAKGALDTHKP